MVRRLRFSVSRRTWFQLAALLIAVLAALPALQSDALLNTRGGGDSPFLLQRVQQLVAALAGGHFPVRWMPDAAYGYGYPFFNYYAPLSIYVAALFRFLGAPYTAAIQLSQLLAFLLAGWAAWALAHRWLAGDWAALLASAAYTLAPFHLVNVYVRGDSLAEFWAMAFYPLVLLAADRLLRPASPPASITPWPLLALALSYAALILSHNISALIFSPFLLLYVLLVILRRDAPDALSLRVALLNVVPALLLALLLSAWFWLPALGETSLVQTGPVTAGFFHYANHFRGLTPASRGLVQPTLLFNWDVAGQTAFRMGLVQTVLILAGSALLLWRVVLSRPSQRPPDRPLDRPSERRLLAGNATPSPEPGRSPARPALIPAIFILLTLAIATVMITPISRPLWDTLPLLSYTQFPWRFLSIQALAGALAAGALALLPGRRLWALLGCLVLLLTTLPSLDVDHIAIGDADVTPLRLAQYEWFTGNIGATVSAEYLPRTVQPRPYTSPWLDDGDRNRLQVLSGQARARLLARHATRQEWQVQVSGEQATLELPTLYWPGWQARLDGKPLAISPAPGSGLITVELPPGEHQLRLSLGRTPIRLVAELLSLAAMLSLVFWVVGRLRVAPRAFWRSLLIGASFLLLLALFWRLRPAPAYDPHTLSWDFAQLGYLHHAPQGIPFNDQARLVRYDLDQDTLLAGETLRVELQWDDVDGVQSPASLALLTPAVHRTAQAPVIAAASQPLRNGRVVYELPVPADAPPGLYVLRLARGDARALTPSGHPRAPLFLSPLRIESPARPAPTSRTLDVRLDDVRVPPDPPRLDAAATGLFDCAARQPSSGGLDVHLAWTTARPLASNLIASLRLVGADGSRLVQCDMQPGYGYLPSGNWMPGVWTPDRLALPLPPALPPSDPYVLLVTLYDAAGNTPLTRRLGQLGWQDEALRFTPHEPQFTLPAGAGMEPLQATFGEAIALRGYQLRRADGALHITLYWEALRDGGADLSRFVHLLQDEAATPVAQQDGAPLNGTYPTAQWIAGEIIADRLSLPFPEPTNAQPALLAVGFYPPQDPTARLPARDAQNQPLPHNRLLIPITPTADR